MIKEEGEWKKTDVFIVRLICDKKLLVLMIKEEGEWKKTDVFIRVQSV